MLAVPCWELCLLVSNRALLLLIRFWDKCFFRESDMIPSHRERTRTPTWIIFQRILLEEKQGYVKNSQLITGCFCFFDLTMFFCRNYWTKREPFLNKKCLISSAPRFGSGVAEFLSPNPLLPPRPRSNCPFFRRNWRPCQFHWRAA
ncbi:MAG: hypothetical protein DDT23_00729 [candidate division WS2 bacterium]|nr:hypothetical protein [Candidatus Lithacetigena glycinireducens]